MEAELFQQLFSDLVPAIGTFVQKVSDYCFSHHLIDDSVQKKLQESLGTSDEDKARTLLMAVKETVKRNPTCIERFMNILELVLPQGGDDLLLKTMKSKLASTSQDKMQTQLSQPSIQPGQASSLRSRSPVPDSPTIQLQSESSHDIVSPLEHDRLPESTDHDFGNTNYHDIVMKFSPKDTGATSDDSLAIPKLLTGNTSTRSTQTGIKFNNGIMHYGCMYFSLFFLILLERTKSANAEPIITLEAKSAPDGTVEDLKHVVRVEFKRIRQKFLTLQTVVREYMRSSKVPLDDIVTHVLEYVEVFDPEIDKKVRLLQEKHLRCVASTDELFIVLGKRWNFLECDMLIRIAEHYGDDVIHKKVEDYHRDLKEFLENRKISELPEDLSLSSCGNGVYEHVVMKLDQNDPTLKEIKELKSKICEILDIMPSTLLIVDVKNGCVEVTFLIPVRIAQYVFGKPITDAQCEALIAASVLTLTWRNKAIMSAVRCETTLYVNIITKLMNPVKCCNTVP